MIKKLISKKNNSKRDVLLKLDLITELRDLGIRIVDEIPDSKGWITCRALDREDRNPSAGFCVSSKRPQIGIFRDFGNGEKLNFFELAVKMGDFADSKKALEFYADKAGVCLSKSFYSQVKMIEGDHNDQYLQWVETKSPIRVSALVDAAVKVAHWPKTFKTPHCCLVFEAVDIVFQPTGAIMYRVDGEDFPAYRKGKPSKTRITKDSKDGWVLIGGKERYKKASIAWKVEGVPDALALHSHLPDNHVVVTNICGAMGAVNCHPKIFMGKIVNAIGDADQPGQRGVEKFAKKVASYAESVRIVKLPFEISEKHGKDARDYFNEGHSFEELEGLANDSNPLESETGDRTRIEISPNEKVVNDQAIKALASHPDIYHRNNILVHVLKGDSASQDIKRSPKAPHIAEISEATLREMLTQSVYFFSEKETSNGSVEIQKPPLIHCVRAILKRGQWPELRELAAITECPIIRPDGTVLDQPGYDEKTQILYIPNGNYHSVPENPSQKEIKQARELILDIVCDFPFSKEEHKSTWVASLLTPLARHAFNDTAPLFLIDANVRGSGKSLLADIVGIIIFGRPMSRMSNPRSDEEARKKITSLAIYGDNLVLIDNIDGFLGCSSLDQALTGTTWKDRILGRSEMVELPLNMTWFGTGNNVVLKADTSRRVAHIRMVSPLEKPEEREGFKHPDIKDHVLKNREELLTAALTLLRGYFAAGKPGMKLMPWGSFENWSNIVRSTVVWTGLPDPGETREELANESDIESQALEGLIAGLEELDQKSNGLTANKIIQKLTIQPFKYELLRSSILELCPSPPEKMPSSRSLGNKLKHLKNRNIGGKTINKRTKDKMSVWFVEDLTEFKKKVTKKKAVKKKISKKSIALKKKGSKGSTGSSTATTRTRKKL
jgi:hypothetical protein